jgi:hypothetical protein
MTQAGDYDRRTLLALTPEKYLAGGYLDEHKKPRAELRGVFATAASTQLEATETSPQELGATLDALAMVLPLHTGAAHARCAEACDEALTTVASMYDKDSNPGIAAWLGACAAAVKTEDDIAALLDHFRAVVRQYAVIAAIANG